MKFEFAHTRIIEGKFAVTFMRNDKMNTMNKYRIVKHNSIQGRYVETLFIYYEKIICFRSLLFPRLWCTPQ